MKGSYRQSVYGNNPNRTRQDRVAIIPDANCGRNNTIRNIIMSKKKGTEKFKVVIGTNGRHTLDYNGIPVNAGDITENTKDGEVTFYAMVGGDGHVSGLKLNGPKKEGMQLQTDAAGDMWVYVDGVDLSLSTSAHGSSYWASYNPHYFLTDNASDIFCSWYTTAHTRKTAFNDAMDYINQRMTSGLPTKKPYILTIEEHFGNGNKTRVGRKWDIKLEITSEKVNAPLTFLKKQPLEDHKA